MAVESIEVDLTPLSDIAPLRRWFPRLAGFRRDALSPSDDSVSVVLDEFMFAVYIGGLGAEVSGTHDGAEFCAAANDGSVDVYIADGVDVRRSKPDDLDAAAATGDLLGASVSAYIVQSL